MIIWKLGKLQKKYTQNLTCRIIIKSKPDACLKSWFKIWHVMKTLIQNLRRQKNFDSKSCFLRNLFHSKSCFLEIFFLQNRAFSENFSSPKSCFLNMHVKRKICAFYGVKWVKTWFFVCKFFFKACFSKIIFSSKSCFLKIFSSNSCFLKIIFSSTSCFLKNIFLPNLTRREIFNSKSDAL